jgi:hypothetical protein
MSQCWPSSPGKIADVINGTDHRRPARFLHFENTFLLPGIIMAPQQWKKFLTERDTIEV